MRPVQPYACVPVALLKAAVSLGGPRPAALKRLTTATERYMRVLEAYEKEYRAGRSQTVPYSDIEQAQQQQIAEAALSMLGLPLRPRKRRMGRP